MTMLLSLTLHSNVYFVIYFLCKKKKKEYVNDSGVIISDYRIAHTWTGIFIAELYKSRKRTYIKTKVEYK